MASTMPGFDSGEHDDDGGGEGYGKFAGAFLADGEQPAQIDQMDGDQQDERAEHAMGKVLERPGEQQEDAGDHAGGGDLRDLTLAAGSLDHGRLGGAAVHDEGPGEGGGGIGGAEPEQVLILAELLAVAQSVSAGGGGALRDDEDRRMIRRWE